MKQPQQFDGSRRHMLDWVETPAFLDTIRQWVRPQGLVIPADTCWVPQSWSNFGESRLFNRTSPFLSADQKLELQEWWLVHSGNIPNWDLILGAATETHEPALVLVEAKAYSDEFDCGAKSAPDAANPRSVENHDQIERAILKANLALAQYHSGISISRDRCYQLSNRIATTWKLASLGITNTLVFLGFTGDLEIGSAETSFSDENHWQRAFAEYAGPSFPMELLDQDIPCGAASFRLIAKSLPVARFSRPFAERQRK